MKMLSRILVAAALVSASASMAFANCNDKSSMRQGKSSAAELQRQLAAESAYAQSRPGFVKPFTLEEKMLFDRFNGDKAN